MGLSKWEGALGLTVFGGGGRQGMVGKEVQCQDWGARSQVANPRVFLSNPMIAVEQDLHRPHYQPSSNT